MRITGKVFVVKIFWKYVYHENFRHHLRFQQLFRRSYRPRTINFPNHRSRIRLRGQQHLVLAWILGLSGDAQIRTLVHALHAEFDQKALRILCDVTPRILRSDFVQVVVELTLVRALTLFRATYVFPIATLTIACQYSNACIRYLSLSSHGHGPCTVQ